MKQYSLLELRKAQLKYPPKYGHYICPPPRHGKSWYAEKIKIMNPKVEIVDKTPTELKGQYEPLVYRDEAFEIYDEMDIDKELEKMRILYLDAILKMAKEKIKEWDKK